MRKITFTDRMRYQFDNIMSKGTIVLIGWLFLASLAMIIIVSLVVVLTGIAPVGEDGSRPGFLEVAWMSLMRTLDSGTMGGDTGRWSFLISMFLVTLGGIFVVSILIGILTSGIESKLDELRKGRSLVAEKNHTVILGWSPQVFTIISELIIANANQRKACIAILAEKDKVEMEDEIQAKVGSTGKTHVVCRTGNPLDIADLDLINPYHARSIIIIPPYDSPNPDAYVIKTTLALVNNPNRRPTPYHIVAEVDDPRNIEIIRTIGGDEVEPVLVGDLISRITVQTCRQSGLSVIYTELLDFGGDEIYFHEEPALVGQTFGQALLAYEDSAVIGLCTRDGQVQLSPPMDTRIEAGDQVIAISEDDDTVCLSGITPQINEAVIRQSVAQPPQPESTLILGWNQRASTIIKELDYYVAAGSEVLVMANLPAEAIETAVQTIELNNLTVSFRPGDITDRRTLNRLDLQTYHHLIVLSYSDTLEPQEADSQTLITLLHLRVMTEKLSHKFSIVSEMLDVRNRELAEITRADDFIVSDKLISLLLTQISENKKLGPVFADLFDPEGVELYLKPVENYVESGQALNFYTVVESALRHGEIALGYRLKALASQADQAYGVVVNPDKSKPVTFSAGDRIIVLAES